MPYTQKKGVRLFTLDEIRGNEWENITVRCHGLKD